MRIITGDLSDDETNDLHMTDLDALAAWREDEWIVCQAVFGMDLPEMYSNARVHFAVNRQSAE